MGDYHINVVCSEEDECYVADTPEEALADVSEELLRPG